MDLNSSLFGKSVVDMTDEELLEHIGGTRNNRREHAANAGKRKKSTKPKKPKKAKVISLSEVMARIDELTPEQAAIVLGKIQSKQTVTEDDFTPTERDGEINIS